MSEYVGLQEQINRNNTRSILLLLAFPALVLGAFMQLLHLQVEMVMADLILN